MSVSTCGRVTLLPTATPEPAQPFEQPWHAELFAATHALAASGAFAWTDWADRFSVALAAASAAAGATDGSDYYDIWLSAFETFLVERALADKDALQSMRDAWVEAYLNTPHGAPVTLREARGAP